MAARLAEVDRSSPLLVESTSGEHRSRFEQQWSPGTPVTKACTQLTSVDGEELCAGEACFNHLPAVDMIESLLVGVRYGCQQLTCTAASAATGRQPSDSIGLERVRARVGPAILCVRERVKRSLERRKIR